MHSEMLLDQSAYRVGFRTNLVDIFPMHVFDPNLLLTFVELSQESAMTLDDVISTLEINDILVKDKELGTYVMVVDRELIEAHCQAVAAKGYLTLKPEKLKWTPFILGRNPGILTFNESMYSQNSLDL